VYNPVELTVPPAGPSRTLQFTPIFEVPRTVAKSWREAPVFRLKLLGQIVTDTDGDGFVVTVTVAVADLVESATLVATT
jgi:predicted RecA/RadA family phage recombinase